MMSESQTELTLKTVGEIAGAFWVPAYQRGFRWGKEQVEQLLQDIWEHVTKAAPGDSSCLQPMVVTRRADGVIPLGPAVEAASLVFRHVIMSSNQFKCRIVECCCEGRSVNCPRSRGTVAGDVTLWREHP